MSLNLHEIITIYLCQSITDLSQTKWNKLLFFIDGAGMGLNSKIFTDFKYIKLPYGPVPNNYRQLIEEMAQKNIISVTTQSDISDTARFIKLNPEEAEHIPEIGNENHLNQILNKIVRLFNDWSAVQLSNFSHKMDAWKEATMYKEIDISRMSNDSFLKEKFNEPNWGKLLLPKVE